MKRIFPKKIIKWFIQFFIYIFAIFFIVTFLTLKIFFSNIDVSNFFAIFLSSFLAFLIVFSIVLLRLAVPLGRLFIKIKYIAHGKEVLNEGEDSYLNELGEFYEANKELSKIHNHLKWQKRIISQESSELEAVISAVNGAIVAVDEDQKILFFNTKATLLFNEEQKVKKKKFLLSEFIRNPDILRCYRKSLEKGRIIRKKIRIGSDSKNELDYEVTVAPFKEGSSIQGAVGLFYDITHIKKVQQSQIDFVSNVSHELRTPLTTIRGYVQTLLSSLEKNTKEQTHQFLETINKNVERLVSLLNHFLEMSQMDATENLEKENLSTETITKSVVKRVNTENHKLEFNFSVKTVKADRRLLEQILYNLLDNAVRYVPEDRLIEIIWEDDKEFTVLRVKDYGKGIPAHHQERLFERFYRVDSARTSSKAGSGIGLSITQQLLEKHGGFIKLISRENEGSEFICKLPK